MLNKFSTETALRVVFLALGLLMVFAVGLTAGGSSGRISATAQVIEPVGAVQLLRTSSDYPQGTISERHIRIAELTNVAKFAQTVSGINGFSSGPSILMWTPHGQSFQIEVTTCNNIAQSDREFLPCVTETLTPTLSIMSIPSLTLPLSVEQETDDEIEYVVSIIYTEN